MHVSKETQARLIQKHGLYGCSNADIKAVMAKEPKNKALAQVCRSIIKQNILSGRE